MSNGHSIFLVLLLLVAMVGCSGLPYSIENGNPPGTPSDEIISTSTSSNIPVVDVTSTPTLPEVVGNKTQTTSGQTLRLWLPPEYDPHINKDSNMILNARLQEFQAANPNLKLEIRVKALEGPGGMIDSLVATSAAAPSDLPDLVLLPRTILESAALKGLLFPYDGLTNIMNDQSWFEYALQLAHLKTSTFGIPFAGDVMLLAHSTELRTTPLSFNEMLSNRETLLYPAADPQALFNLGMYLAEGGKLQDEQGRPALEATPLTNILNYVEQARLSEVMPYTLTQFSDDAQVWEALLGGQYPMAITWASTYLRGTGAGQISLAIAPLPTPDGTPFTLATGWSWALAGQDPARRPSAVKLAEYLVEKEFLARWTQAAGYLPPRVDSLQGWQAAETRQVIEQLSYSAWLLPSADLLTSIGPALQTAVVNVLEGRQDPQAAAQSAIHQVNQP
ncbi:MAG TPA: extracellular solute-binding protein [Anaerolineales bacterium]|nr:extracellular solute-binding protein [Anaerolineales bacterium]